MRRRREGKGKPEAQGGVSVPGAPGMSSPYRAGSVSQCEYPFYLNYIFLAKEWAEQGVQSKSGLPDKRQASEKISSSTKGYRDLILHFSCTN